MGAASTASSSASALAISGSLADAALTISRSGFHVGAIGARHVRYGRFSHNRGWLHAHPLADDIDRRGYLMTQIVDGGM